MGGLIKLCPFCGYPCEMDTTTFGDSMIIYYRIRCIGPKSHSLDQWNDTPEEAVESWNERKNCC
jgi:hypothetical protein